MVNLYDEALLAKFEKWTSKTDIHIYGNEESRKLFEVIADTTNDKPITLPLIALRRRGGYTILNINKRPLTYDGFVIDGNETQAMVLNAIPISIQYQLDIYTRYLKEADAYCRDFIFNIINHPNVQITVPYNNANFVHNSTIRLSADVEDNSSIPERLVTGQFTRMSLLIDIDDAYLWDTKIRKNVSLNIDGVWEPTTTSPAPDKDNPNWDDDIIENLDGVNVVVQDTKDEAFVIEPIKL